MKTVEQELADLRAINDFSKRFDAGMALSDRARAVMYAQDCIAGDFRAELAKVHDDDLSLLITSAAKSVGKTRLLVARMRRRAKQSEGK